ncbi:MAG: elongation factor G [Candidatus Omnitrophota bacterium]|nr:MAG: elongation factor G [Candidatus Omnitrophota bacterium]
MDKYNENSIRNIAFVSHLGAGKTSLVEAILYKQEMTNRLGSVLDGNSSSDYDKIEIERKISINTSLLHCIAGKTKINLLDTPGYADFHLELLNVLPAADSAVVVVSAYDGIEVGTQRAWDALESQNMPRAIFISKLDKENTDYFKVLDTLQENFGKKCIPVFLPIGKAENLKGIVNLLTKENWDKLSQQEQDKAEQLRRGLLESVAEVDDELVEEYLEGKELTVIEITKALKTGIKDNKIIPVVCGNVFSLVGIKELVQFFVDYLPAPFDTQGIEGLEIKTQEKKIVMPQTSGAFNAFVFKTISNPYVGKLTLFKVVSGTLNSNTEFLNLNREVTERIGQIYVLQGKEQIPVDSVCAGDIAAVAKLKNTITGDSLSDAKNKILFNCKVNLEPVISYSLKPKSRQDEEKISQALTKLSIEDQGIKISIDQQTKELILSGMGNLHLEITIARLKNRYKVEVEVGTPKVPYRETIKKSAKTQAKYKRQTGGHGQYGDVWVEIEPLEHGSDFEFVNKIVGGVIPRQYIPSVEKGVRKAMSEGALAGYPLVDLKVTLYDGSYHDVDSSDMAFQIAGAMALRKAVLEAHPILIEPVMDIEVVIPPEYMGAINGDLSSRRGKMQGMGIVGKYETIAAQVPLSEMLKYATDLRSLTHGRGSYTMKFSHYEDVPVKIAEKIIARSKETSSKD